MTSVQTLQRPSATVPQEYGTSFEVIKSGVSTYFLQSAYVPTGTANTSGAAAATNASDSFTYTSTVLDGLTNGDYVLVTSALSVPPIPEGIYLIASFSNSSGTSSFDLIDVYSGLAVTATATGAITVTEVVPHLIRAIETQEVVSGSSSTLRQRQLHFTTTDGTNPIPYATAVSDLLGARTRVIATTEFRQDVVPVDLNAAFNGAGSTI